MYWLLDRRRTQPQQHPGLLLADVASGVEATAPPAASTGHRRRRHPLRGPPSHGRDLRGPPPSSTPSAPMAPYTW